ncbi:Rho GTPase activating protein [Entomophthora muscae]|uniref:Rho GTPase activating protein n=1 Tax=Entomophthora muscae TaxID=34485 RepID=A0ACC2RSN2_9FUNG|nr:Rho GTPase activating protein [Entomophthora muscae]
MESALSRDTKPLTLGQEFSQSELVDKHQNSNIPKESPLSGSFPKVFFIPEPPSKSPSEEPSINQPPKPLSELSSEEVPLFKIFSGKLEALDSIVLTNAPKSEEPSSAEPTLHKVPSDTALRWQHASGTYPGNSSTRKIRVDDGVKLQVPRRSSLRGRPDLSKDSSPEGTVSKGSKRVSDLRKVASNEERLKTIELFEKPSVGLCHGIPEHSNPSSPEQDAATSKVSLQRSFSESSAPLSPTRSNQTQAKHSPMTSPESNRTINNVAALTPLISAALSREAAGNSALLEEETHEVESGSIHDSESLASQHSGTSFDVHEILKGFSTDNSKKISNRSRPLKMVLEENGLQNIPHDDEPQEAQKVENDSLSRNNSHNRKAAFMGSSSAPPQASNIPKEMSVNERAKFLRKEFPHLTVKLTTKPLNETNGPGVLFHLTLIGQAAYTTSKEPGGEGELPPIPVELWHLEKTWDQLTSLETQLLSSLLPKYLALMSPLPPWPAPSPPLVQGVQGFLTCIAQLPEEASIHTGDPIGVFLSTGLVDGRTPAECVSKKPIYKAGSLLKRGKKLGKLMLRFFIASSPTLEYFESSEGTYLGSINLAGAQIVRSAVASLHSEVYDKYIYAIAIMERKRGVLVKHTFFIDNPADWDEWINVLEHYSRSEVRNESGPRSAESHENVISPTPSSPTEADPYSSALSVGDLKSPKHAPAAKGPRKDLTNDKDIPKPSSVPRKTFQWNTKLFADAFQKKTPGQHKIFGVPLEVAIAHAPIKTGYQMPSVVHRCIEYLEKHEAFLEEGIYRLSGSAADIQHLKDKFDSDGDYNLLKSGARYDVHTVAGLLKLYLREMPTYVLTQELQPEFLKVVEIQERHLRVNELGRLVCTLPLANYTLLRTLIAHLIRIVERSDVNRMTLRNIGIVFVPTLAVPAGVFNLMIAEFEFVFWVNEQGGASPKYLEHTPSIHDADAEPQPDADLDLTKPISRHAPRSSLRDNRNSAIYRDVVPQELVTVEHGLEDIDYDSDGSSISLTEKVSNDSWNYGKTTTDNELLLTDIQEPTLGQELNTIPIPPKTS